MRKTIETLETAIQEAIEQLQDAFDTLQAVDREIDVQKDVALKANPISATKEQMRKLARMQVNCTISATDLKIQIERLKNQLPKGNE